MTTSLRESAASGEPTRGGVSHRFLTDWTDGTGLWRSFWTPSRTLTCSSGLQRTDRTPFIDLRIKRRWPRHTLERSPVGDGLSWSLRLGPRTDPGLGQVGDELDSAPDPRLIVPSSSLPDCLGRVRCVKAKPHAVASRALTQRPRPERRQLSRRTGEDQGAAIRADRNSVCRAISGPLTPVTRGLSRSLADTPPRRSGHVTGPDGTASQADSAGSIPVTRSAKYPLY